MTLFVLGLVLFFAAHFFSAIAWGPRNAVVAKIGSSAFKGLFSLVALAGFALIIVGWPNADAGLIYAPPAYMRHITFLLTAPAIILLVAAYAPAGKIAPAVKHPMLAAVKVWSLAHLLANGEVRSVILFGAFLAFAVVDRIAAKKKGAAIREPGPVTNDIVVVVVGLAVYLAILLYLHRYIAGVPLM